MALSVEIDKTLGNFHLQTRFEAGSDVLALLGASGCGKSMTLKCIAGIERPDRGRIELDGVTLFDSERGINLPPQRRRVGYLFQQYALFPNMTVWQNVAAGVREKARVREVVPPMLAAMHLTGMENKRPAQLSGGQQQRVALARILVNEPDVLLLDEPFSALDSHLRFQLEQELRSAVHRFGKTTLLVSHNRDEVFRLSDRIAVMADGHIEAMGTKKEVFADPKTRNGAILTGCKNVSRVERLGPHRVRAIDWGVELTLSADADRAAYVGIRMHDICGVSGQDAGENVFCCRVEEEIENPFSFTIMLRPLGAEGTAPVGWEMDKEIWARWRGEQVFVRLPPEAILRLEEGSMN